MSDSPVDHVIPPHNIAIIRSLSHFVVENLRTARRFLKRCDRDIQIDTLTFAELNEHTPPQEVQALIHPMEQGHSIGVISEAGCPAIADPGADLVAIAQRKGFDVVPLVGPSSIILALMASGFNGQSFAFNGYLPIEQQTRNAKLREMLRRIDRERQTQIFIETPYRNNRLVQELAATLPPSTLLCAASDITGSKQSIRTMPLANWAKATYDFNKIPTIFLLFN